MKLNYWVQIGLTLVYLAVVSPALAVTVPSFPACTSPQGTTKVSYSDGTHGIVGSTSTYTGADTVYTVTAETLMQCFCPKEGDTGVQSNWWKATNLSQSDIDVLKNEGWNFVPNGSLWGLENVPYMVKNNEYVCRSTGGGDVQSASAQIGDVLGLADTGNIVLLLGTGIGGLALLLLGVYVYFAARK